MQGELSGTPEWSTVEPLIKDSHKDTSMIRIPL